MERVNSSLQWEERNPSEDLTRMRVSICSTGAGSSRISDESAVMGLERRGCASSSREASNRTKGEHAEL